MRSSWPDSLNEEYGRVHGRNGYLNTGNTVASAVPYCDVVVTDREMASLVRRTKLDKRLGTIVLHRLEDLC